MRCFIFVFLLAITALAHKGYKPAHIRRAIVHDLNSTRPPASIDEVRDTNHSAMTGPVCGNRSFNIIYTKEQADEMNAGAEDWFSVKFGFNFSLSNPSIVNDPVTDTRKLFNGSNMSDLIAVYMPFKEVENCENYVQSDTKYPKRGESGNWSQVVFTNFAVFQKSGICGGEFAGQQYNYFSTITFGYFDYLNRGTNYSAVNKKGKWINREQFKIRSNTIGQIAPNPYPGAGFDFHFYMMVLDSKDRLCLYQEGPNNHVVWSLNATGPVTRMLADHVLCPY